MPQEAAVGIPAQDEAASHAAEPTGDLLPAPCTKILGVEFMYF